MSQSLYSMRLAQHLQHASSLCTSGDYIQAGEKIWGAVSALVNARYPTEVFSVPDKKRRFLTMLTIYETSHPNLKREMQQLGFRRYDDIFDSAYGLHKFFYGGTHYPNRFLSTLIPFLVRLISSL